MPYGSKEIAAFLWCHILALVSFGAALCARPWRLTKRAEAGICFMWITLALICAGILSLHRYECGFIVLVFIPFLTKRRRHE